MVLGLLGAGGYHLYKNNLPATLPIQITLTESGADISIQNFKVAHEVSGRKDWELKAESAEINNQKNLTYLKNVEMEMSLENQQKFWVKAEQGILNNKTNEFELEGRVRVTADAAQIVKKIHSTPEPEATPN